MTSSKSRVGPLTFGQEALWLAEQIEPGSSLLCVPFMLRFRGALDTHALKNALSRVTQRHASLRTSFPTVDTQVCQVVSEDSEAAFAVVDLTGRAEAEREALATAAVRRSIEEPFDLTSGPLFKVDVYRIRADEHVVVLRFHHIIVDGASANVIFAEIRALYNAEVRGVGADLPEIEHDCLQHALWQRSRTAAERESHSSYWREQLAAAPSALRLPLDHPQLVRQLYDCENFDFRLDRELVGRLRTLGAIHRSTLFTVLVSAIQVFLVRYSGQTDVVLGVPVAGRSRPDVRQTVGAFANILPVRTRVRDSMSFSDLLDNVRDHLADAYQHEEFPFSEIMGGFDLRGEKHCTPLVQAVLNFRNYDYSGSGWDSLTLSDHQRLPSTRSLYEIVITFELSKDGGLHGRVEYASKLFDMSTIRRMVLNLISLITSAVAFPRDSLLDIPMLNAGEKQTLLEAWNRSEQDYAIDSSIDRIFSGWASNMPNSIAVVFGNERLTYRDLDVRSNTIARALIDKGVVLGSRVAIVAERCLDLPAYVMGVLKAGAAWIPIDPTYPSERVDLMLRDSNPDVVIVQPGFELAIRGQAVTICIDASAENALGYSTEAIEPRSDLSAPVYIIYTSGSTGTPKGAVNSHAGVLNRLLWMRQRLSIGPDDAVMLKAPFSFDVSAMEMLAPLISGARIVLAAPEGHLDANYLWSLVEKESVTMIDFVPSMLASFLDCKPGPLPQSLRYISCGGESLPTDVCTETLRRFHGRFDNLYGPTECSFDVAFWECCAEELIDGKGVPIGRAVGNTRIYLLDASLQPVPIGVIGELYVGGLAVGQGYLNRPALTAERFLPNPWDDKSRLYRTGDLARYTNAGLLDFQGRTDTQVKIRGLRIELGEIETALARLASVRHAVVDVKVANGGQVLVAYLVADEPVDTIFLKAKLRAALPEYMLPSLFVHLNALPLTPSGKVDRAALPMPALTDPDQQYRPPQSETEAAVAFVWGEVLETPRISVDSNFLDLGGHSLLAMRLVAKLNRLFDAHLSMRILFEAPTIAEIATCIDEMRRDKEHNIPLSSDSAKVSRK